MMSSTMPSAKYSCSGSPLIFWNGKTAIDGLSGSASDKGGVAGVAPHAFPSSFFNAAFLRRRRTPLSMPWCATPRPTASCAASFAGVNGDIVVALESDSPQVAPELIAWHAGLAGLDRKAMEYLLRAGYGATERYANQEAVNYLDRALRLIGNL